MLPALAAALLAPASQPSPPPAPAEEAVALGEDQEDRMTVPVTINGGGPYAFVVDTGAERTVIARELAETLGLDRGRSIRVHSMSGVGDIGSFVIPALSVSNRAANRVDAPAFARFNLGAEGLLGIDSLKAHRVLFDFERGRMTIAPSRMPVERLDPDTIVVTARSRFGRLILTEAVVAGQRVRVIVDTGSEYTIANLALRRALEKRGRLPALTPVEIRSVTGGLVRGEVGTVGDLNIGGLKLTNLALAFAEVHPFRQLQLDDRPAILLGMNALKAFDRVSIDFATRKIRFDMPDDAALGSRIRLAGTR